MAIALDPGGSIRRESGVADVNRDLIARVGGVRRLGELHDRPRAREAGDVEVDGCADSRRGEREQRVRLGVVLHRRALHGRIGLVELVPRPEGRRAARESLEVGEAALSERAVRQARAESDSAVQPDRSARVPFRARRAQRVEWHVLGAGQMPDAELLCRAHVDDACALDGRRIVLRVPEREIAAHDVGRDEARHVDGVFRRAERRSVGELELFEVEHGHAHAHRRGEHVDALVDAVEAGCLAAEHAARLGVEHDLQMHHRRAGVVASVA